MKPFLKTLRRRVSAFFAQRLLPPLAHGLLRLILATCRLEFCGLETFRREAKGNGGLLALWHNRLLLAPYFAGVITPELPYVAVISNSRDGDPLAQLTASFPNGQSLRIPYENRSAALKSLIRVLKQEQNPLLVITPDGPRGPCYTAKGGLALAASRSEKPIFPFSWTASSYWELPTWDRMRIPKPFAHVRFLLGPAIHVPPKKAAGKQGFAEKEAALSQALHDPLSGDG